MSSSRFTREEEEECKTVQNVLSAEYKLTDEEKKIMMQCSWESSMYRAIPLSIVSMVITRKLITRGLLSASPRFGSLPKVGFAGFCGYVVGKLSYIKTCQEKLKTLPNSPVGEFLRQRSGSAQPQVSELNVPSYDTPMFQPEETPYDVSSITTGDGQMGQPDNTPVQSYEDEEPKKSILYENLRLRNRENYEVMLNQKPDTMIKAPSEKEPERPKKPVMKNTYGDTWEE